MGKIERGEVSIDQKSTSQWETGWTRSLAEITCALCHQETDEKKRSALWQQGEGIVRWAQIKRWAVNVEDGAQPGRSPATSAIRPQIGGSAD